MNLRKQQRQRGCKRSHHAARQTPSVLIMLPEKWESKEPAPAVTAAHGAPFTGFLQRWIVHVAKDVHRARTAEETAALIQKTRYNLNNAEHKAWLRGRLKILGGVYPIGLPKEVPPVGTLVDVEFVYSVSYSLNAEKS